MRTDYSFKEWIIMNYPEYSMAQQTSEAANTNYAALQARFSGPLFAGLDQKRKKLNLALDVTGPNTSVEINVVYLVNNLTCEQIQLCHRRVIRRVRLV